MAIKPPALRRGDTIGIVTLGSPLPAETIRARIAYVRQMGFDVVQGRNIFAETGYLAGTAQTRAEDLMSMFTNPRVKLILPARGGVGVEGILPFLDYPTIARNPKLVTGYSDITILLNVLYRFADLVTLHSLLLIDFRPETPAYNFNQFFAAATTTVGTRRIVNPPGYTLTAKVRGNVTAPLVGGNLTSLVGTLGTPFEVDTRGRILFLEEVHEPINTVYRYIEQLRAAGKFRDCVGIVMGQCSNCLPAYGRTYEQLIDEVLVPIGKPLLTNLASGHGYYKAAIPIGVSYNLNANAATLTQMEPAVRPSPPVR